jgi:hypothetical protein
VVEVGLLWFDDNPKVPVATKVENAAKRYREKFGKSPDVCYVHPATLASANTLPKDVKLIGSGSISPNSFWIGLRIP